MDAQTRLQAGEGDIIEPGDGTVADDDAMSAGSHYDYRAQRWCDGHDHAHYLDDKGPLFFCGADLETCASGHAEAPWAIALANVRAHASETTETWNGPAHELRAMRLAEHGAAYDQ